MQAVVQPMMTGFQAELANRLGVQPAQETPGGEAQPGEEGEGGGGGGRRASEKKKSKKKMKKSSSTSGLKKSSSRSRASSRVSHGSKKSGGGGGEYPYSLNMPVSSVCACYMMALWLR